MSRPSSNSRKSQHERKQKREQENEKPYKPDPTKPTNPDIRVEAQKKIPNPNSSPNDNNNPPSPEDIHDLPPDEPIKPDNPIDVVPDLSTPSPTESEEEVKKECIKSLGEEFYKKIFEPGLAATRYIETSIPHSPRNLQEFITKWDERAKNTNQEIFSSPVISSTNDFFGEYITPLIERKKVYILCSSWRRKADNSLDWIDYKKRLKEPSLMVLKSREGYEAIKKFLREKLNPYLQNLIDSFSKISSLTEFNQWLNEYANLMTLGEVLMEMSCQMAKQLGAEFQWSLPFYKSLLVNSPEIGQFGINFFTFDFQVS